MSKKYRLRKTASAAEVAERARMVKCGQYPYSSAGCFVHGSRLAETNGVDPDDMAPGDWMRLGALDVLASLLNGMDTGERIHVALGEWRTQHSR